MSETSETCTAEEVVADPFEIVVHSGPTSDSEDSHVEQFLGARGPLTLCHHPGWLDVFRRAFGFEAHLIQARSQGRTVGLLPLVDVRGPLFGRTLSSLPYLNYGGALAIDAPTTTLLIDQALEISRSTGGVPLLLRHAEAVAHPGLAPHSGSRVNVRRPLPPTVAELDAAIGSKCRNQVRKGRKLGLTVHWGGEDLLPEFHRIFAVNMRDLGTPVYGAALFREALRRFPGRAEICLVRLEGQAIAGAFLTHGWGVTEVPSASSLRAYNSSNANMLMYWHLLERALERGQESFDFGRCVPDDSVYKFKVNWGGQPMPADWQVDSAGRARLTNTQGSARKRLTKSWQRLPLAVANRLGPVIIKGLP